MRIQKEINTYLERLHREVSTTEQYEEIIECGRQSAKKESELVKRRQIKKFDELYRRRFGHGLDPDKVVRNYSQRCLLSDEKQVLALGLNFAVTPKSIPTDTIIANTEATARRLDAQTAEKLRSHVSTVLQRASLPKCNLATHLRRAVRSLREDKSIVILPADKGNSTVVMNRCEYDEKLTTMLSDSTYKRLKKDPTAKIERQVAKALRESEDRGELPKERRLLLTPHASVAPQLYGLPKVHKEGIQLRPIVSAIGSPTYSLAKEIAKILSPLVGRTSSYIKNSTHFVQKIRNTPLDKSDRLVSFDVVSLFTKVPVNEAMVVIEEMLENDESIDERTSMSPGEVCRLTSLCLRSTHFRFKDDFFEQCDGAAMGSPLSPVVANLYMEAFEERALSSSTLTPKLWLRYIDDTFVVWPHGLSSLEEFHSHLNKQHPSIQFTREEESKCKIPFLDTMVERKERTVTTTVYRKPTHTDRYLHFLSHHHGKQLLSTICSLRDRAHNVCGKSERGRELSHLTGVFHTNGYPKPLVRRTLSRTPPSSSKEECRVKNEDDDDNTEIEQPKILCLPYIKGVSEKIERGCRQLGVRAVFKSGHKLRQSLMRVKTAIKDEEKKGVVYELPCGKCEQVYIGETGRNLKERLKEHQYAVKKENPKNGIAAHACQQHHEVNWDEAKVRCREQHYWKRKVLEAIHIWQQPNTSNLDCGLQINPVWLPHLKKP